MQQSIVRALTIVTSLAALLSSGCSGKSLNRMLTLPTQPAASYSYTPANYSAPYGNDPYLNDSNYTRDPLVRFPSDTRLAGYDVGNVLSGHLAEFSGAFSNNFATLHLQLPYGLSTVSPLRYVMASPAVAASANATVPVTYSLNVSSARDTVSFVTYGLYSPTATQHVSGIDVKGAASFATGSEHGLYVGVRQFGEPRYNWYGPFKANERWHVAALRDSNYQAGSAAYVTLAVFNGDYVRVDSLSFDMGG